MTTSWRVHHGDCLDVLRGMPARSVDLVLCSPPYEAARTYGMGFTLRGEEWVEWCHPDPCHGHALVRLIEEYAERYEGRELPPALKDAND